ncbi:DUF2442 domain-containing protein [Adhaeribacter rhizoryzae]|uniref:DUF2442 domain-containing protein n=1 Tax=Adhaeribacter rhizoryzae TaxID=2607907 RepID=A0A5M6D9Q1_9BACT|nr:DUF2442 domain-containing protein [Adhaeribacter rhizoryzae]KAA5543316.1 DUF2442 domain-containing protein [Adhaeribacter rhizoryzae]
MKILVDKIAEASAVAVWFDDIKMYVRLVDGRELGVPLDWFPKLRDSSTEERNNWRFIGRGKGIHWESIDEDLSVSGLLRTK